MSSRPTPPQPAPLFTHTPETLIERTKKLIEEAKALEDEVVAKITPETATFQNVLQPLCDQSSEMGTETHILGFYQYVSPNKELRDASSEAEKLLDDYGIESSMREDMYKLVHAIHETPSLKPEVAEAAYLLEKDHKDYLRNGLSLPEAERARFKEILKELSTLSINFSKNLNEEKGGIWFTPEELKGVPEDVLSGLKKGEGENEGKLFLTYKYPDLLPTMKYCQVPETRKKVLLGNEAKCPDNVELFRKAVVLRDEKARLLGYKSHSEFVLDNRMAKSPEKVESFLADLREKLTPGGIKEREKLLELKKETEGSGDKYFLWDNAFYNRLMLEKEYQLDAQKIAEYFPVLNTIEKMLGIFETIFGLEFVQITDEKELEGRIWHPDCKLFQVWNKGFEEDKEDGFVGWLYLDLHPREGKYGHAANFNLEPGFTKKDGGRHYPATALVCNFSKPTETKPSLLKHEEVVTLFHELGHGIHDLVSVTIYSRFHGTSVVRDFVEAPSQMLENWCWKPEQLKALSSHYQTKETLPDSLITALVRTQHVNDALANLRQIHFGTFDMKVHNIPSHEAAETIDPTVEYNKLRTEIALLDPPEEDKGANKFGQGQSTFGHMMGGYDSGYYGYLWSQVFSADMFYTAFKANPMDRTHGQRYRKMVLQKGGSQDEMETLKAFLGREPNSDAFLKELGLK